MDAYFDATDRKVALAVQPFLNDFFTKQCHMVVFPLAERRG